MKQFLTFSAFLLVIIFFQGQSLFAQENDGLQQRLQGKKNLKQIMEIVDQYYDYGKAPFLKQEPQKQGEQVEFENDYLHWKRWEYYWSSHLDENGDLATNVPRKLYDGLEQYKNSHVAKTDASYGIWIGFGPTGITRYGTGYNSGYGRVNCIAFHPSDANTLYAGTPQGGVWKTTNHGSSWFSLTDDLPSSGISGLVVDSTNVNVIYALTGDGDGSSGFVQAMDLPSNPSVFLKQPMQAPAGSQPVIFRMLQERFTATN